MNVYVRLVLLLAASTLLNTRSHAQVAESWATEIPVGPGFPIDLVVRPNGHLHLFGWGGQTDSSAAKLDPAGAVLWSHRYDSNLSTLNGPVDQEVDGAGNAYVVRNENLLFKYAGDGSLLWAKLLYATNGDTVFIHRLALDASGRTIIAGSSFGPNNESDFLTLKCDTNGTVLWSARYDGGFYEGQPLLAVDPADNIYLAGTMSDLTSGTDLAVVKYDGNGRQLWVAHYDNPAHGSDFPVAVHVDPAGNVYVSGFSHANPSHPNLSRLEVLKFDASGQLLWTAHYSGAPSEFLQATAAALDASGNLFVAGLVYDVIDNSGDMVLVKFDAAGHRKWAARYNGPRRSTESARGLVLDSSGYAYVTGDSQEGSDTTNPNATYYFTQKFDPSGNRLWSISRPADPSFYNYPAGVGLDATGGVYIAGRYYIDHDNAGWLAVKYVQSPAPGLPAILSPPANETVSPGSTVAFSVTATGNAPLSYQWRYNGRVISRATNATLTLNNLQFAQRGGYSVDVSNAVGVVATAEAELVVLEPPAITLQPSSQTAFLGTEAGFTVAVAGLDPFIYQWRHDGNDLPGATNATLALFNVQTADAGGYSVRVGNIAGSITSQTAVLTVSTQVMRSWVARYDGPAQGIELNPLLTLDGEGLPVVTTTSQGTVTDFDFATFKHDLAGARLWASRFNSASNQADYATALFTDAAGNVYVAGHSLGGEQPALSAAKYDAAGQLLWSMTTNHAWRTDVPCVITADSAGNAYLAASTAEEVVTIKYDPAGHVAWSTNYNNSDYNEQPRGIAVDPAGNICVGIREDYYCCTDFRLVKYAPDGRELWRTSYDGDDGTDGGADTLFGMALDGMGNIYLGGQVPDARFGRALAVVKFDSDGNFVWMGRHGFLSDRYDAPSAFAVNSSGASWLAYVSSASGSDAQSDEDPPDAFDAVVHFSPDGHERWVSVPTSPGLGNLSGLAADNAGNVYSAGTIIREGSGSDLAASRIDPHGNLLWTALYNGPANGQDNGSAIAVGSTGDIFVAGTSGDSAGLPDVVLLKYRENMVPGLPAILSPPTNILTRVGSNVTFTVTATGAVPLRYQWLFNGTPLSGATNVSLAIQRVSYGDKADSGFYAVEVSNPEGAVRSPAARLQTVPPPVIVEQPVRQDSVAGAGAYFTVNAASLEPLTYQWHFNGVPIAGATNTTLVLENLQPAQGGNYSVVIRDAAGTVSSQPATLIVSSAARQCGAIPIPPGGRSPLIRVDASRNLFSASMGEGITKRDAAGQPQWSMPFPGLPLALALGQDGSVYVTGYSNGVISYSYGQTNLITRRYDANGNLLWSRLDISGSPAFYLSSADYPVRMQVDNAGNVVVLDTELVKFAPDGTRLWVADSGGIPIELELDTAGNIYVASASGGELVTAKRSPSGVQLWAVSRQDMLSLTADMALDNAGNVYLTSLPEWGGGGDLVTAKYDIQGNELWVSRYPGPSALGSYIRDAIAVDDSGHVYVSGMRNESILTLKYDPAGQRLWSVRHTGVGRVVRDITPGTAGDLYVTAYSPLTTIKYDSNGTQLWIARNGGPLGDAARISVQATGGPGEFYASTVVGTNPVILKYCDQDVPGLPGIVEPPHGQSVASGATATFSVAASGANPLSYQWRFNGLAIPGATGSTILLPNAQPAIAGGYSVEVFNPLGSVVSVEAALSVHVPASITSAPADECVVAGSVARFRVSVAGDSPITYQWSFGGLEIPGATNDTLLVSNVQPGLAGLYTVRTSNPYGSAAASASLSLLPNVQQLWARTFDNVNPPPISAFDLDDWPTRSAIDSAGNLYVAGFSIVPNPFGPGRTRDIFIVKYDTNGTLQWVAHHGTTNSADRRPTAIAVNTAGEVHLAVQDYTATNAPALLKYSGSGQLLWSARFEGADFPTPRGLALDASGNAYVIEDVFRVMKVSPNGTSLWTAARQSSSANAVTVDDAGNVYVAGAAGGPGNEQPYGRGNDYLTVKYNAAGVEQWNRTFRGPHGLDNSAYAIAVDHLGNVIVTGSYVVQPGDYGNSFIRLNFGTLKYDANGNVVWFADYGDTDTADFPAAMAIDAAGNVLITGLSDRLDGSGRWVTLKYSAGGALDWTREFGFGVSIYDSPAGLAVDAAGNAHVSGALRDESSQSIITTVKYGPAGDELWSAPAPLQEFGFSGLGYGNFVVGVHVDNSGRVLVAGRIGSHTHDVVALAYVQEVSQGAPVILSQPQDVTVPFRGTVQFSVTASNALRYQWELNGQDLSGANSATLVIPAADWNHEGGYAVRVENDIYCVASRAAKLTLNVPVPVIAEQGFNSYFHCLAVVTPGRSYRIEASPDLVNWTTVWQDRVYGRTISFYDYASPWQPWRFYRVMQEP